MDVEIVFVLQAARGLSASFMSQRTIPIGIYFHMIIPTIIIQTVLYGII